MSQSLTDGLIHVTTLNGMLRMQNAVLRWAKVHRETLHSVDLVRSLVATLEEEVRLHEVSTTAEQAIKKAAA